MAEPGKTLKTKIEHLFAQDENVDVAEATREAYTRWSTEYDQDLTVRCLYTGPVSILNAVEEVFSDNRGARIIDLGSGTGLCGETLHKRGYYNLDALDSSEGMLRIAKDKGVYSKYFCEYLGTNKLPILDATYDGLVLCGVFGPNHANDDCFEELVRILKPGGYFVFVINQNHLKTPDFKDRFEPRLKDFVDRGVWRIVKKVTIDHFLQYDFDVHPQPGSLYILQKC